MALQLNITDTEVGASFNAAYAKIVHFHGENMPDAGVMVDFIVDCYASSAAREQNARPVHRMHFGIRLPEGDLMVGLYNHLKTLPEFEGAEDC
jgi:hypothetical protein